MCTSCISESVPGLHLRNRQISLDGDPVPGIIPALVIHARVLEVEAAPLAAGAEHGDVAAVGVDVHQLGVEREHPQRRHTITVLPM